MGGPACSSYYEQYFYSIYYSQTVDQTDDHDLTAASEGELTVSPRRVVTVATSIRPIPYRPLCLHYEGCAWTRVLELLGTRYLRGY